MVVHIEASVEDITGYITHPESVSPDGIYEIL